MTVDQASPSGPDSLTAAVKAEAGTNVCVAVHVRPLIDLETAEGCQETLFTTPGQPQVSTPTNHNFSFDHVFGPSATPPSRLFDNCIQPLVGGLFKGYNATVLAYGQTGSGKTYTMGSAFTPGGNDAGVIPKVMQSLYTRINAEKDSADFAVRVGFVEIHKEEIRDLLWKESGPRPNVSVREQAGGGVCLAGAQEQEVGTYVEMAQVLEMGSLCRATASTSMNAQSSRSHAIFTITLEQRKRSAGRAPSPKGSTASDETDGEEAEVEEDAVEDEYLCAKMHLVDLAGSERAKRTKAEGQRLKEGIHINKGLLALGNVISALCDENRMKSGSHVPYRDSKLTRLLQDSLGGNSRTCMLACVSPADVNLEETLNTLKYAARARNIRNTPVVNRDAGSAQVSHLKQQLAAARAEVACLKKELHEGGRSVRYSGEDSLLQAAITELEDRCSEQEKELERTKIQNESLRTEADANHAAMLEAKTERDLLQHQLVKAKDAGFVPEDMGGMLDKSMMETYLGKIAKLESENRRLKQMQHLSSTFFTARRQSGAGMTPGGVHTPGGVSGSPYVGPAVADLDATPITPSGLTDEDDLEEHARTHEHDRLGMELHKLQNALEEKEKALRELQERGKVSALKEHYDRVLKEANAECESLSKERSQLKQKLQAIAASDKDTKKRMEDKYRSRIRELEAQMKMASKRAAEASRFEKLKSRTDETCKRLNDEILRMKQQKVALAKAVEQSHKEMNEYKKRKDKELAQAKRAGMKSAAEVQKLAALHEKQQQVLKRKTEEADAARRRLREMSGKNIARAERAASSKRDVKSEKERREWVEKELELCNQVLDMQRVLDGEMAQRGECARQLMEVRRQLTIAQNPEIMSPGMRSASPAKAAASKELLMKEEHRLGEAIKAHSEQIAQVQETIMQARAEEEQSSSGASKKEQDEKDIRRWEIVRTLPDSKLMLRTLFRSAATARSLACETDAAYAEARDELELMRLKYQQADYEARMAKRSAAAAEAAAAAALDAKAEVEEQLASTQATGDGDDGDVETLLKELDSVRDEFCGRGVEAAAAPVETNGTPDFSGVGASVHLGASQENPMTSRRYSEQDTPGGPMTPAEEFLSESESDEDYDGEDEYDEEDVEDEQADPTWEVADATPVVKPSRRSGGGKTAGSHWRHPAAGHDDLDTEVHILGNVNREREEKGLDPVNRLTVQLMKEFLTGKSFNGKPWKGTGKMNRAQLVQQCEIVLDMIGTDPEAEDEQEGRLPQTTPMATLAAVRSTPGKRGGSNTTVGSTPSTAVAQQDTARYIRMATDARRRANELKDHMQRRESAIFGRDQRRASDASSAGSDSTANLVMASLNLETAMQAEGEVTSRPLVNPKFPRPAIAGALAELTTNLPSTARAAAPKMKRLQSSNASTFLPALDPDF